MNTEWVRNYFKTVDTLNADAIAAYFTEDGKFRFSNQPPAVGKQAVRDALAQFFETIQAMHHENTGLWLGDDGNSAVWEADVTYTRKNGTQLTLPRLKADGILKENPTFAEKIPASRGVL